MSAHVATVALPMPAQAPGRGELPALLALAVAAGLAWGLANTLGWWLSGASDSFGGTYVHFGYEAVLQLVLLAFGLRAADAWTARDPQRFGPYVVAAVAAAIGGEILFVASAPALGVETCYCGMVRWTEGMRTANMLPDAILICGFVAAGYWYRRRALARAARLGVVALDRARIERQMQESRLQAMQATIEPEFLFDTLARVETLQASDPKGAARMLDDLIVYLRAALPRLGETTSTASREGELAGAFLAIERRRRQPRGMRFRVTVAPAAEGARMPTMLVLPLVDFALSAAGADEIDVGVEFDVDGARLRVAVWCGGAAIPAGGAPPVDAIRERLAAIYGDGATISLASSAPLSIVMELPHESTDGGHR
ncbi:MAG: histidine kinase [Burkholderiales bacterium]